MKGLETQPPPSLLLASPPKSNPKRSAMRLCPLWYCACSWAGVIIYHHTHRLHCPIKKLKSKKSLLESYPGWSHPDTEQFSPISFQTLCFSKIVSILNQTQFSISINTNSVNLKKITSKFPLSASYDQKYSFSNLALFYYRARYLLSEGSIIRI